MCSPGAMGGYGFGREHLLRGNRLCDFGTIPLAHQSPSRPEAAMGSSSCSEPLCARRPVGPHQAMASLGLPGTSPATSYPWSSPGAPASRGSGSFSRPPWGVPTSPAVPIPVYAANLYYQDYLKQYSQYMDAIRKYSTPH